MRAGGALAVAALLGGVACATAVACSVLVPLNDVQCTQDQDCVAHAGAGSSCVNHVCQASTAAPDASDAGPDAGDPWACLDQPGEVLDPGARLDVQLQPFDALSPITTAGGIDGGSDFDLVSATLLPGVSVYGCNTLDPTCLKPVTPTTVTDDAGSAHLTVPGDFDGFFVLNRPDMLPSTVYPGKPPANVTMVEDLAPMISLQGTALLAQTLQLTIIVDASAGPDAVGLAFFQIYDCQDHHAAGVTFTLSVHGPQQVQFYTSSGLPISSSNQTDYLGAGGAINVPVGPLTVTATLAGTGRTLGTVSTLVRAGQTTDLWFRVRTH